MKYSQSLFKKKYVIACMLFAVNFFIVLVPHAFAASGGITLTNPLAGGTTTNPLAGVTTPEQFIGRIIQGVLGLVGVVTLVMFLWGGFIWLFSFGEPERVKKGLNTMLWTGAGLVTIFGSTVVIRWFLKVLTDTATR